MPTTHTTNLNQYIAYFEEPEPGVPIGGSGWYHSSGQFAVQGAADVFKTSSTGQSNLLKPQIIGPFQSQAQAIGDLQDSLSG